MKQRRLVSMLGALLVMAGLAVAQATFTTVTGTEAPNGLTNPGDVKCHGALPTGNPFAPCPTGVSGTVRGQERTALETTNDARLNGTNHVVANANYHEDGSANIWGTFRIEIAPGVNWEGVWEGAQQANGAISYSATGHGSGGSIEGMQLLWDGHYDAGSYIANITARILAPAKVNH